jgi:hypothetical protein
MSAIDEMLKNPLRKDVEDIKKSDFIIHNKQYLLHVQPRYSVSPVSLAIDEDQWDEFDDDLIRRLVQNQIDKDRDKFFDDLRGPLNDSFKLFWESRNF